MPNVKYTDSNGLTWIVGVPPGVSPETYRWGVPVGPPDLSSLGLDKKDHVALQAALVEHTLIEAPQLIGKRKELFDILADLGLPKELLREIVSLYQQAYYSD